jgi:hypothetical protein
MDEPNSVPEEKSVEKSVATMMPARNGGALRKGSAKGNTPGTGRPPSALRAIAREGFAETLPIVKRIAKSRKAKDADRIRAADVLGKYGMSTPVTIDDVRERIRQQNDEIREYLSAEQAETLISRLRAIWLAL